jgi:hypothetical protein
MRIYARRCHLLYIAACGKNFAKMAPFIAEYSLLKLIVNMRKLMKASLQALTELAFRFQLRGFPIQTCQVCSGIFRTKFVRIQI